MKKAITILAVLIVLVGAVFADETHTIRVKADVTEVLPAFQLALLTPAQTYTTNKPAEGDPNVYGVANYDDLTDQTAKDINFNLDEAGTVNVEVYVANLAKTVKGFTFAFSDGVFNVSRNGVTNSGTEQNPVYLTYGPNSITVSKGAEKTGFYTTDLVNNVAKIKFTGKTLTNTEKGSVVASAIYNYPGDTTIDPGTYYADITLTIATY